MSEAEAVTNCPQGREDIKRLVLRVVQDTFGNECGLPPEKDTSTDANYLRDRV